MAKRKKGSKTRPNQLFISVMALISLLLLFLAYSQQGMIGKYLSILLYYLLGEKAEVFIVFLMIVSGFYALSLQRLTAPKRTVLAIILFFTALQLYFAISLNAGFETKLLLEDFIMNTPKMLAENQGYRSGLLGTTLFVLSSLLFDVLGTYLIAGIMTLLALLLLVKNQGYSRFFAWFKGLFTASEEEESAYQRPVKVKTEKPKKEKRRRNDETEREPVFYNEDMIYSAKPKAKKRPTNFIDITGVDETPETIEDARENRKQRNTRIANYKLPSIDLLDRPKIDRSNENLIVAQKKGQILLATLKQFDVAATLAATHIGPSVTKFEIVPEVGIKVNRISSLADDLKMALAAHFIRIEAPIPGHNTIGIEIPNEKMTNVSFREIYEQLPNQATELTLVLGKDLQGQAVFLDLDKMPHLLVAGATGSGKSVCINSFIVSLLMRAKPDEVRLILIDPKRVEFMNYQKLPHLQTEIITDLKKAAGALKVVVEEMEKRYAIFSESRVRNITGYHEMYNNSSDRNALENLPFWIVIIDELADLMMIAGKEVEVLIQRLTQKARAAGIYLIIATQRPSTDVITGIIKANIPSRIAFAVSSGIDSRTILDTVGAERLLGRGDMLYYPSGQSGPKRLQGSYLSDDEINRVCEFWRDNYSDHHDVDERFNELGSGEEKSNGGLSAERDPLYGEVKSYILSTGRASVSAIQRRFGLGYNRAARIMDMLEENGIVMPQQGSKPREINWQSEEDDD